MQILECLESWIRLGAIPIAMIDASIVDSCFTSLSDPILFEVCTDIICEVIVKSGGDVRNDAVVQMIYPRLLPLSQLLQENIEDPDVVRGLCRIFTEAGETYPDLIVSNFSHFQHLVSSLLICASYDDLEIAKITFNVWFLIAEQITSPSNSACLPQFTPIYHQLITIIIKHLQYPENLDTWKSQERDEFKEFRYVMGDVLKDCVRVLGQDSLITPYNILRQLFQNSATAVPLDSSVSWQQIEAPLFSLRAMCREVSLTENKYLTEIMTLLPRLPSHPKIKYAAILVIGRYAEWTNLHPDMLSYQLDFVSNGFEKENQKASSCTFCDLCKYCSKVLIFNAAFNQLFAAATSVLY